MMAVAISTFALGVSPAQADSATVSVSGFSNLYNDWLLSTNGAQDATPVPGLEVCDGGTVEVSATGCARDDGSRCTGPDGYA